MSNGRTGAGVGLKIASGLVMAFLYFPLAIIVLYSFTTQSTSFTFPPPGLTLHWFGVAFARLMSTRAIVRMGTASALLMATASIALGGYWIAAAL